MDPLFFNIQIGPTLTIKVTSSPNYGPTLLRACQLFWLLGLLPTHSSSSLPTFDSLVYYQSVLLPNLWHTWSITSQTPWHLSPPTRREFHRPNTLGPSLVKLFGTSVHQQEENFTGPTLRRHLDPPPRREFHWPNFEKTPRSTTKKRISSAQLWEDTSIHHQEENFTGPTLRRIHLPLSSSNS